MSGTSLFWKALLAAGIVGIAGLTSCRQSQNGKSLEEMANSPSYSQKQASAAEKSEQKIEGEYRLIVSLHQPKMYIFMNDSMIKEFPIAVGDFDTQTPKGEYFIKDKVKDPEWKIPPKKLKELKKDYPSGYIPAGDPKNPITLYWIELGEIRHPGKNVSFGIHGTNNPKSIPDWVSMGCIRMTDEGILYIANHVPIGSRVTIMENFVPGQADYR